jgi:PhzF family phenazine biosynthesis protein
MQINVSYYEAFSDIPGHGNPAGVVFDADNLNEEQMQSIAKKVGFNETAFFNEFREGCSMRYAILFFVWTQFSFIYLAANHKKFVTK